MSLDHFFKGHVSGSESEQVEAHNINANMPNDSDQGATSVLMIQNSQAIMEDVGSFGAAHMDFQDAIFPSQHIVVWSFFGCK